jgi:hypothetical protein
MVNRCRLLVAVFDPRVLLQIEQLKTGMRDSGLNLIQTKFLDIEISWVPLR